MTEQEDLARVRRHLVLASATGMASIAALPLTATLGPGIAALMVFALPLTLALVGKLRDAPRMIGVALVLLLVLAGAVGTGLLAATTGVSGSAADLAGIIVFVVTLAAPIIAIVVVGVPLRGVDTIAAGGFLGTGTIAVIAGMGTAGTAGSVPLVLGLSLVGVTVVAYRLARAETR